MQMRRASKENTFQFDHAIFSLLKKVSHTQKAIIKLIEKDIGGLSSKEKEKILQSKDAQDGCTPLIWAARNGSDDLIRYFVQSLKSGSLSDSNILDQTGGWNQATALMKAVEFNHLNAISVLIDLKANLDIKNDLGSTAVMLAAEKGHLEIVDKFIRSRANLNLQNKFGYTALMVAAEKGHTEIVKILGKEGADKTVVNQLGKTALIIAAEHNNVSCITALFDENPEVRQKVSKMFGDNPTYDPKINHQCDSGMTALMSAASRGHDAAVNLLLERGANTVLKCKDGNFALTYAFLSDTKYIAVIKRLLNKPQPGDLRNDKGCTPFMLAAESGKLKIVELLLEEKSDKQAEKLCRERSEDDSTALHLAAAKGHIKVLLYLINRAPRHTKLQNKQGKTATQLLSDFYIENETRFSEFVDESKTSKFKRELFELIPEILPKFKSPNFVLNECFGRILISIKNGDEMDIVTNLVNLSVGLKLAIFSCPLEAADLQERLDVVQQMLLEVMRVREMDNDQNVLVVIECRKLLNREFSENLHCARTFMQGPLMLCLKHQFLTVLGTRQLYVFVDRVFNNSLRVQKPRPLETFKDIFQMRSNCINWRTNPAFSFYFEGFCKFMTFCFVTVLLWQQSPLTLEYIHPNYESHVFENLAIVLEVIVASWVLGEFGKLQFLGFNHKVYFGEVWAYLDVAALVLLVAWATFSLQSRHDDYAFVASGLNANVTASTITNFDIPQPPSKGLLALTDVLLSIGLLKYMSTSAEIGHYVLMLMAMVWNTRNFLLIFLVCSAGFIFAFHGLFPFMDDFRTTERTMLQLFFALNGQFNSKSSIFEGDPNENVGIVLFVLFITMSNVILINIMTATFAAIYDDINAKAKANWCYMKARVVQQYLQIIPKNSLYTLPAPFNLIPLLFSPIHYAYIRQKKKARKPPPVAAALSPTSGPNRRISMEGYLNASGSIKGNFFLEDTDHTCSCDCRGSAGQEINQGTPFLSICDTVSDITSGLLILFPCAFYEMYLCLYEIRKYQKKQDLVWKCLVVAIIGFPFFYLGFVITLLIEIARVRTWLVFDETDEVQVFYENDKKAMVTTPPIVMDSKKDYTSLNIKIMRTELVVHKSLLGSQLSRTANVYAVVTIDHQMLVTSRVECLDSKAEFRDAKKDFLLCLKDSNVQASTVKVDLFDDDDALLGTYTESTSNWIASERFEGLLELKLNSESVGHIFVSVEVVDQRKRIGCELVEIPVKITSVSAQISRCIALDTKAFTGFSHYVIKLSLGENSTKSSLVVFDGYALTFNESLCVSTESTELDVENTEMLHIELFKTSKISDESKSEPSFVSSVAYGSPMKSAADRKMSNVSARKMSNVSARKMSKISDRKRSTLPSFVGGDGTFVAACSIAPNGPANEEISGEFEMCVTGVCVCKIELSVTLTSETVMIQKSKTAQFLWKNAYAKVHIMLLMQRLYGGKNNLGNCTCGKQVTHTCRAKKNRTRNLFTEADLERIFLGVESEQQCALKSEFSYELHHEIKKVTNKMDRSEKQIHALQTDLHSLTKTVQEISTKLDKSSPTIEDDASSKADDDCSDDD